MKIFGAFLCVAAAVTLLIGFNLDTSVPTSLGYRVNNTGLLNDQQNLIIFGGALLIAGIVLITLWGRGKPQSNSIKTGYRKCPSCAELVRNEAKICRYCQQSLPSMEELQAQAAAERERLAAAKAKEAEEARLIEEKLPKGFCPNCEKAIPLSSLECKYCHAKFIMEGGWRVLPELPNKKKHK